MTDPVPNPRSGARDNGLRCAGYVALGDLDPRVADAMLEALRDHGIAAYVTPTPGARGGYLEVRLPAELTNRLFVDGSKLDRARELVGIERAAEGEPATPPDDRPADDRDLDSAWQELLVSLQTPSSAVTATWPSSEDVALDAPADESTAAPTGSPDLAEMYDEEDEHFVPPPAPPFPQLRPVTLAAVLAILGGILVLVTQVDGGAWDWVAIIAIIAGGASLAWHVKEGPPTDSGWDDGAVV
jgi:hypothetical protein